MKNNKVVRKFSWQSFISLGLLFSFILMAASGIVLYIAPEGSLSRWIDWDLLGLTKKQWERQHTIFSYLLILFSIFHIFKINWSYLASYFFVEKLKLSYLREILVAVLLIILVFIGTLFNYNPFRSVIQFGENISDNYSTNVELTDISDAEKLTLNDFAKMVFNINFDQLKAYLERYNMDSIDENTKVMDFCKSNNISPEEFYKSVKCILLNQQNIKSHNIPDITSYSSYFGDKKSIL